MPASKASRLAPLQVIASLSRQKAALGATYSSYPATREGGHEMEAAPTKVCPHCGTQAATTEKKCPSCGKGYKRRTGLKIFAGIVLAGLVLIVGCALLIGGAVDERHQRGAAARDLEGPVRLDRPGDLAGRGREDARRSRRQPGVRAEELLQEGAPELVLHLLQREGQGAVRGQHLPVLLHRAEAGLEKRLLADRLAGELSSAERETAGPPSWRAPSRSAPTHSGRPPRRGHSGRGAGGRMGR